MSDNPSPLPSDTPPSNTSTEDSTPSASALDLMSCLHPFERSRLMIALVGGLGVLFGVTTLIIVTFGLAVLIILMVVFTVLLGFVWIVLQLFRARLLANAVRVEPETLPDVYTALTAVRNQLGYYRRVDVYVASEVPRKATWLNFLGHRVILLEGDFVDRMASIHGQAALRFMLGSYLGALKARHARLEPLVFLLEFFDAAKFALPFMLPYHRATRYSGDQLAYLCSGSLQASAGAVGSLLVGNMVSPALKLHGVVDQIELVQQRVLPRLTQLFVSAPHLVNRYLNLLAFSAQVSAHDFRAFTADLDSTTRQRLEWLMASTPHSRKESVQQAQKRVPWPVLVGVSSAAFALIAVILLVFTWNNNDRQIAELTPSPSADDPSAVVPVSPYTAWQLFGADERNGDCQTSSNPYLLTGYEVEEVTCRGEEYDRWFYKYSNIDPDGWVSALADNPYYDTVELYESADCYDLYAATFTVDDGTRYNSALYVFTRYPFVAEVGGPAAVSGMSDVLDADAYTTDSSALC